MAKKCQKGLRRARIMPCFKIWPRIVKIQIFLVKKMPLVFYFDPNLAKRFFLPRKRRSATFRWVPPFSIAFLWSQSSGFASNFRNLVRNCDFGPAIPARLTALQTNGKNQKTVLPDSFFWFDGFQSTKSLQTTFWPSFETFYHQKVQFWPIFQFLAITTETGPRVLKWPFWLVFGLKKPVDGFPILNNEFLSILNQKKGGFEKRYHKCIK